MSNPPQPPGPPPPPFFSAPAKQLAPSLPTLELTRMVREDNSILLSLLTYNGQPFMDHWEFFLSTSIPDTSSPSRGVSISPSGNVHTGFYLEISRGRDISVQNPPNRVIPLQWISHEQFGSEWDMALIDGKGETEGSLEMRPALVGRFEETLGGVKMPGKSLRNASIAETEGNNKIRRITQRNCQTWVVECAEELVKVRLVGKTVAEYLSATRQ